MSLQELVFDLEPGGAEFQGIAESNYLFVDYADFPFTMEVDGGTVTLRKGSKFRYRGGMFSKLVLKNTSPDLANNLRLFVGTHEADNQIIQGEVSITPVLWDASGQTRPDTRYDLTIDLTPITLAGEEFTEGQYLATANPGDDWESQTVCCWGPGDVIAQVHLKQGPQWAIGEYDQKLNLLNLYRVKYSTPGSIESMGWTPGLGYFCINSDARRTVRSLPPGTGGSAPSIRSFSKDAEGMTTDPERDLIYIFFDDRTVAEYYGADFSETGKTWDLSGTVAFDDNWKISFDRARQQFAVSVDNVLYYFDRSFNPVQSFSPEPFSGNFNSLDCVFLDNIVFYPRGWRGKPETMWKRVLFDFTSKPEVRSIKPGCALISAKRKAVETIQPTGITFEYAGNYLRATGEVIRGLLEYYFQRTVADDYLDHVYGLDLSLDANGTTFKPIVTGNETFARAGVADDFTFLIPNRATLKIDNELELGSALALKGV